MTKQQIVSSMLEIGIVPIIRVNSEEAAIKSIEAVYEGGIRSAEITMTTPGRSGRSKSWPMRLATR